MNNNVRNIWIEVEGTLTQRSENELREILLQESRQIVNRFRWIVGLGIAICAGVLFFLILASFSLQSDLLYLINNSLLAVLLIVVLVINIRFFYGLEPVTAGSNSFSNLLKERNRKIKNAMQQK